jgi:hypothetical protein
VPDPARRPFTYALLRVVPSISRGERINVGVVLHCRQLDFLDMRVALDADRLRSLAPELDPAPVRSRIDALCAVVAGRPEAGPLAELPLSERFGWLTAPSSTIIQPSQIHTGLTADPEATLEHLFATLVANG